MHECVTEEEIAKIVAKWTGIPVAKLTESERNKILHLDDELHKRVIGQEDAVSAVAKAVRRGRVGLKDPKRPIGSFLFLGPTGVGKTELSKALAEALFGKEDAMIRVDMSEYMEEHSVPKLIGAPPGYKDAGNGKAGNGLLINAIDENPYCILLLDEIEKAHPKIHNLLLQVMDNGKLTSSMGKSVSFENVFLIMTSNVGSYNSHKIRIGFGNTDESPSDKDFEDSFLPEFRNRIDSVITFNDLPLNVLKEICKKFLNELK